jgi:Flp pilus assembly protein TadD
LPYSFLRISAKGGEVKIKLILLSSINLINAYVEQARTFSRQGDTQKAIAQFNNAIRTRPNDAYLYSESANLRRQNLEDKDGALEDYTQAINLHPDNPLF